MALANSPAAVLKFEFEDASGSRGSTNIHVPWATPVAAVMAAADILRPLLQALSDAVIVGQSLTYSQFETGIIAPVAGSRVEEKGYFQWNLANGRKSSFTIPAIVDTVLNTSGSVNKTAVTAAALIAGVTAVDAIFCGADGSDITSLSTAYQRFNRSSRSQLPNDR